MLFRSGVTDPELSKRAEDIITRRRNKIVTPTRALACSHMRDISMRGAVSPARVGRTPVLFVHGKEDIVSSAERIAAYASTFQSHSLMVLPGQGHQIFITDERLFDRVGQFFSQ